MEVDKWSAIKKTRAAQSVYGTQMSKQIKRKVSKVYSAYGLITDHLL